MARDVLILGAEHLRTEFAGKPQRLVQVAGILQGRRMARPGYSVDKEVSLEALGHAVAAVHQHLSGRVRRHADEHALLGLRGR